MLLALFLACTPTTTPSAGAPTTSEEDSADTGSDTAATDGARWTFAVFMNGDNNLESYVTHDLNELEEVGSTDGVNVVVQADRIPGYSTDDGDWTGTRRYFITGDKDDDVVHSEVVEDMGELDMGDPAVLSDFLLWADQTYPAEHMAVILWDHGDGWTMTDDAAPPVSDAISDDETSGTWMSVAEGQLVDGLAPVVAERGPLDVIGFDACNMASWEVAHALRHSADYLAASEATVGWSGLQYAPALAFLRDTPDATGAELADNLAREAAETGGEWTFSATDLSQMDAVATSLDALAGLYLGDKARFADWQTRRSDARAVDHTYPNWYMDLGDFAAVTAGSNDPKEAALGGAVSDALEGAMVGSYGNMPYAWAGGLTVFTATHKGAYLDLYHSGAGASWAQATRWDDLLLAVSSAELR